MNLQFLYFDECPSWVQALENLRTALAKMGWEAEIEIIKVETDEQAARFAFQGSPSIKYQGVDLWPSQQTEFHLGCRVYATPNGLRGVPSVEMLQHRLTELRG